MKHQTLIKSLAKKHQKDSQIFIDLTKRVDCNVIPFRSIVLNAITGVGGVPRGRFTEIFGTESSGKTTLAIELCADLLNTDSDAVVVYLDYEHVFDPSYATHLGLDLGSDRFVFAQPDNFEQGFDVLDQFITQDAADLYIVDSGSAMVPKAALEAETDGTMQIGHRARLMSVMLNRLTKKLTAGRQPALLMINQMRNKIGANPYLSGMNSTACEAEKFYASLRMKLEIQTREGGNQRSKNPWSQMYLQNKVRAVTVKNKVASPYRKGLFVIEYGKGVSNLVSVAEMAAKDVGMMGGGGYITFTGSKPETSVHVRGMDQFVEALRTNDDLYKEVCTAVMKDIEHKLGLELGPGINNKAKVDDEIVSSIEEDLENLPESD